MSDIAIVVLIGLPGSGKSTYSKNLIGSDLASARVDQLDADGPTDRRRLACQPGDSWGLIYHHIEFDTIIPYALVVVCFRLSLFGLKVACEWNKY